MNPLINLTRAYSPTNANGSAEAVTSSQITSTLASLCSASSGCSDDLIRSYLSQFYAACSVELTDPTAYSAQVREIYDYLYVLNPFRGAVCAKDSSSQRYCVLEIANSALASSTKANANATANADSNSNSTSASNSSSSAAVNSTNPATNATNMIAINSYATYTNLAQEVLGPVAQAAANLIVYTKSSSSSIAKRFLNARAPEDESVLETIENTLISPNTTTYRLTSLPYLFLQPNMSSSLLCASCTKTVMAAYASWEAQIPYALGLSSSPILGNQMALWQGISETCGANFTQSITDLAGILASNGSVVAPTSGAMSRASQSFGTVALAGLVGLVGLAVAL